MSDEIVVDRNVLRAIGADTRIEILKALDQRQKTQTELATALMLSGPTVLEHLNHLESAGLIERVPEDVARKWKYYRLTKTGRRIISKTPVNVIIILAFSLMVALAAFLLILQAAAFSNNPAFSKPTELQQASTPKNPISNTDTSWYIAMNSMAVHPETTDLTRDKIGNSSNNKPYTIKPASEKPDGPKLGQPKESVFPEIVIFGISVLVAGICIWHLIKKN